MSTTQQMPTSAWPNAGSLRQAKAVALPDQHNNRLNIAAKSFPNECPVLSHAAAYPNVFGAKFQVSPTGILAGSRNESFRPILAF